MNKWKYWLLMAVLFCIFSIDAFADEHVKIDTYDFTTQKWSYEYVTDRAVKMSTDVDDHEIAPFAIIGTDNRSKVTNTTEYPYSCIGSIYVKTVSNDSWKFRGSGFLVAPSLMLTAAHCVYDQKDTITEIRFTPAKNGSTNPYGHAYSTKIHVPADFKDSTSYDSKHDYALIELDKPIGNTAGYFPEIHMEKWDNVDPIKDPDPDQFYKMNNRGCIAGYPKQYSNLMYRESGVIYHRNSALYLYYKVDTTDGQDGGPIFFTDDNGVKKYMGIHIINDCEEFPGYNQGRAMTLAIYTLINKYK